MCQLFFNIIKEEGMGVIFGNTCSIFHSYNATTNVIVKNLPKCNNLLSTLLSYAIELGKGYYYL